MKNIVNPGKQPWIPKTNYELLKKKGAVKSYAASKGRPTGVKGNSGGKAVPVLL